MSMKSGTFRTSDLELVGSAPPRADNFVVGDAVFLSSGGPEMIVEAIAGSDHACAWKDGRGRRQVGTFPGICLTRVERGTRDEDGCYGPVIYH